jgi:hypothetical protein
MTAIEAESVSCLLCARRAYNQIGKMLPEYRKPDDIESPFFGLNALFQATDHVKIFSSANLIGTLDGTSHNFAARATTALPIASSLACQMVRITVPKIPNRPKTSSKNRNDCSRVKGEMKKRNACTMSMNQYPRFWTGFSTAFSSMDCAVGRGNKQEVEADKKFLIDGFRLTLLTRAVKKVHPSVLAREERNKERG